MHLNIPGILSVLSKYWPLVSFQVSYEYITTEYCNSSSWSIPHVRVMMGPHDQHIHIFLSFSQQISLSLCCIDSGVEKQTASIL